MAFAILEGCLDVLDRACVDVCPVDCIYEGERKLYIHPDECIGCGACLPACPVSAIVEIRRVPPDRAAFVADNRLFFSEVLPGRSEPLGTPGGAHRTGPIGVDSALVRSRQPMT